MESDSEMCENKTFICSEGLIFPTSIEAKWPIPLRACLYLLALLYSFLGIALISDVFMCAIERIASATIKIRVKNNGGNIWAGKTVQYERILIWNPTIANISLMAMGTSAPEILVALIEIIGNNFKAGELGPGTAVGSAAFNLMIISAICITSVPRGQTRSVENFPVFCVTAFWNIFAYIWLLIILLGFSKDEIEIWEGALTLLFFCIALLSAYLVDKRLYDRCLKPRDRSISIAPFSRDFSLTPIDDLAVQSLDDNNSYCYPAWRKIERKVTLDYPNINDEDLAKLVALKIHADRPKDYLDHRIGAIRTITHSTSFRDTYFENEEVESSKALPVILYFEFAAAVYCINPFTDHQVHLKVVRRGPSDKRIVFHYHTVNGTARKNVHYVPKSERGYIEPGDEETRIIINILKEVDWKHDDVFTIKLDADGSLADDHVRIGRCSVAEIIYIADEVSGYSINSEIEFVKHFVNVKINESYVRLPVSRKGATKQKVTVEYNTERISHPFDNDISGVITFNDNEVETYCDIPLTESGIGKQKMFLVKLLNPSANATLGQTCIVVVNNDRFEKLDSMVPEILQKLEHGERSWPDQFYQNLNVNGGDAASARTADYFFHILSFPWKTLCAFVPPPVYLGGWLTFIVALSLIAFVTVFIIDLAKTFGCLINLDTTVTAITLVALGTSLPDAFASKIAALHDKNADNAIGNITGSNIVNVFVGLGLPWFMASIYWATKGEKFHVPSGDIGFSVTLYVLGGLVTIFILFARRYFNIFGKAELGGPIATKWFCSVVLVIIWMLYILLSSFQVYGYINAHF